jgi:hypothetical protein
MKKVIKKLPKKRYGDSVKLSTAKADSSLAANMKRSAGYSQLSDEEKKIIETKLQNPKKVRETGKEKTIGSTPASYVPTGRPGTSVGGFKGASLYNQKKSGSVSKMSGYKKGGSVKSKKK